MVYSKTEAGQLAFKVRSAQLSVRQRSAFILFDGVKLDAEVLAATAGLGISQDDIAHLVKQGFLKAASDVVAVSAVAPIAAGTRLAESAQALPVTERSPQERYSAALPIATKLTASGFDDLLALLPKIQHAVGVTPCVALAQALKG